MKRSKSKAKTGNQDGDSPLSATEAARDLQPDASSSSNVTKVHTGADITAPPAGPAEAKKTEPTPGGSAGANGEKEVRVAFSLVDFDETFRARAAINEDKVNEYAEQMAAGDKFPPVHLFARGECYVVVDGWHRLRALMKNGCTECLAVIHHGGHQDALKFAIDANCRHGLPRSNADKRRSVELALKEFGSLSSNEIARLCSVSHTMVDDVRKDLQLADSASSAGADGDAQAEHAETRTGADGKRRRRRSKKPTQNGEQQSQADRGDAESKRSPSRPARFAAVQAQISEVKAKVEELRDELQNWLDSMPDNLRDGQKAEAIGSAIETLETVIASLEEAEQAEVEFSGMFG